MTRLVGVIMASHGENLLQSLPVATEASDIETKSGDLNFNDLDEKAQVRSAGEHHLCNVEP